MEVRREDIAVIQTRLDQFPAVVILGPRQVGKTTLALQIGKNWKKPFVYLDLESSRDVAKLGDDPETFFDHHQDKLVILDEIQSQPHLFAILRSVIDRKRERGRFLLLGSATPDLVKGVSQSLTGRIGYFDLNPLKLTEAAPFFSPERHWHRGGFPLALLAEDDTAYMEWIQSFIRSYIQTDLSYLFGHNLNPSISEKLLFMLANSHGQLMNAQDFARSIGVTSPVISRYIDFLEGAFLVYRLQPWFTNLPKRLVKSPKVYIKDSGLLHGLHYIETFDQLTLHPVIGASWEGYAIEQVSYHMSNQLKPYFYRTQTGAEIGLVLVRANKPLVSIEIKYSNAPKPTKGFFVAIDDLKTTRNFIITPSSDTYPLGNATVCSLSAFIRDFLPGL
ncbi:MAG: ATP-binding protein [Bacteroidales bacterium]|jgi:predicted AAA+ superfamily ATPase|nr:ATP-binding protein [Bacteroidales bacterium]NLM91774.1 ATP-binding protein [Bacteroidales bacterium]